MSAQWPYQGSSAPFADASTSQVHIQGDTAENSKKRKRQGDSQGNMYHQMSNTEASQGKGKQRATDQDDLGGSEKPSLQSQALQNIPNTNSTKAEDDIDMDEELEEGEISEDEAGEAEAIADLIVAPQLKPKSTSKIQAAISPSVPPPAQLPQASPFIQSQPSPSYASALGKPPISIKSQASPSIARSQTALQSQQAVASTKLGMHQKPIQPPLHLQSGMSQDVMNDCITLIEQLYSWGMTVDYMLGQGLEKDLVLHVFVERGFKLPPHHLQYYQDKLSGQALGKSAIPTGPKMRQKASPSFPRPSPTSNYGPPRGPAAQHSPPAPYQSNLPQPAAVPAPSSMPAASRIDLSEKEAKARNALLARKAKIAKKNAEKAQDFMAMEAQLSDLLAGIASDNVKAPAEDSSSGEDMQIDSDDNEEAGASEAVADEKAASPAIAESPALVKEEAVEPLSTQNANKQPVSTARRPVASDFEAEPVQALANVPRWSAHLAPSTRASDMIISLSDNESDDDSDTEQLRTVLKETKKQDLNGKSPGYSIATGLPSLSRKASPIPVAPPPSAKQAPASPVVSKAEAPQLDAKAQLEAKQAEIKRMMEMISKLEKKKTTGSKTASRSGTPASISVTTPIAVSDQVNPLDAHMKASAEKKHLRQAIETVEQLLEEKQELVEKVEESQQAIAKDMQVEQVAAIEEVQGAVEGLEDAQMATGPEQVERADSLDPYNEEHGSSDDDDMLIVTSNQSTEAATVKEGTSTDNHEQESMIQDLGQAEETEITHGTST